MLRGVGSASTVLPDLVLRARWRPGRGTDPGESARPRRSGRPGAGPDDRTLPSRCTASASPSATTISSNASPATCSRAFPKKACCSSGGCVPNHSRTCSRSSKPGQVDVVTRNSGSMTGTCARCGDACPVATTARPCERSGFFATVRVIEGRIPRGTGHAHRLALAHITNCRYPWSNASRAGRIDDVPSSQTGVRVSW